MACGQGDKNLQQRTKMRSPLEASGQPGIGGDAGEGRAAVSPREDGGAVSKDRHQLHLASWLAQQFLQEV